MNKLRKVIDTGKKCLSFVKASVLADSQTESWTVPASEPNPALPTGNRSSCLNGGRERTLMVLDVSTSMRAADFLPSTRLDAAKDASIEMVRRKHAIDQSDEIGVVCFSNGSRTACPPLPVGECFGEITDAIRGLQADGRTDMGEGLSISRQQLQKNRGAAWSVNERIVLLTDGHATDRPIPHADALKEEGVTIDVIGIGATPRDVNEKLLRQIASIVNGEVRYRFITERDELVDHFGRLATKIVKID